LANERAFCGVHVCDDVLHELRADMFGLRLHLLHEPGPLDDIGKAWIVFHIGGDGQLAAGLQAGDENRFQHRAGGVDRGGVTSRAGPDDENLGVKRLRHEREP
jgi:hypothetical protein